ncbi:hypothetical protein WJX81_000385 [Elliptochloris bilobata]|uniref:Uncharacterized protein n=1 Tax=Elliptochloris bilobata TaxID=381761 RepID=A0AAW1RJI4_9CHLO
MLAPAWAETPYTQARSIQCGPTADGRIRPCLGGVNPNCTSTSSLNDLYGPAWRSSESTAEATLQVLDGAVASVCPKAELIAEKAVAGVAQRALYRAYAVPSLFGRDTLEFLVRESGAADRRWRGDSEGPIVTCRSMAGSVKYVWLQTAVLDGGAQLRRLDAIRNELGWRVIGCKYIECYS